MRNKHHRTNHKLGKRAFALCLALAVICSCLVPVFATGTGVATMDGGFAIDTGFGVGGEDAGFAVEPMDGGFAVEPMDDGFAVDTGEDADVDTGMTPGTGIVVTPPVADDSSSSASTSGPTITTKETEYGTVTEYDWGDSQTTWKDDEITITPNDNLKEDDAAFGVLPIEYHFWLQQLDSFTFDTLSYEAEMAEMSVTEYLALFGSSKQFPIWHMDTIADTDTISNYKFADPTAKDDPEGQNREFAYWYTVDENGVETEFDPYKSYGSETNTTVNVFAKWKDASGDVVDETIKTETKTDEKKENASGILSAEAVIAGTSDKVTVTVEGLPATATHLSVTGMGDTSMQNFYNLYTELGGKLAPLMGFKITPKDAGGNTVQPTGKVTVKISGLGDMGLEALTGLRVLHQTVEHEIETLDASYGEGTVYFSTSSFSPFVVASENGYDVKVLELTGDELVTVNQTITLKGSTSKCAYSSWESSDDSIATVDSNGKVTGIAEGWVTITHKYCNGYSYWGSHYHNYTSETKKVYVRSGTGNWVYIYTKVDKDSDTKGLVLNDNGWYTLGRIYVTGIGDVGRNDLKKNSDSTDPNVQNYKRTGNTKFDAVMTALGDKTSVSYGSAVERYGSNTTIDLKDIDWTYYGLVGDAGAINYVAGGNQWHLDGLLKASTLSNYTVNYYIKGTQTKLKDSLTGASCVASIGTTVNAYELGLVDDTIVYRGQTYGFDSSNPENAEITIVKDSTKNVINLYYTLKTSALKVSKSVTGLLGEKSVDFKFRLYIKSTSASYASDATWEKHTTDTNQTISSGNSLGAVEGYKQFGGEQYAAYAFVLKHNETIEFNNLPVGAYFVEEDDYGGSGYTTTYILDGSDPTPGNTVMVELQNSGAEVKFTNERTLDPDTGVLLDTLPYLVILAVVAGGGILLMLRKRRKNDD